MTHPKFAQRFNQAVKYAGVVNTQVALGQLLGVSSVTIWGYRNGKKLPRMNTATRIAGILGVSVDWLLTGRGQSPGTLTEIGADKKTTVAQEPRMHGRIPLISWIQAGTFCEAVDIFELGDAEAWLPCPVNHSDTAYALRVKGDSMASPHPGQKSYPEGTIVFVDPNKPLTNGCRVIAKFNGEVTFKTYAEDMGRIFLRPINPSYPAMDVTDKEVSFCGVLLGAFTPD
ncbi:MAG: XRE family transcriptional regulator [Gammaproteobacteria bacterium]|nr:XRE family transcriptional regulator [Gammaproteobacteria bacterium]